MSVEINYIKIKNRFKNRRIKAYLRYIVKQAEKSKIIERWVNEKNNKNQHMMRSQHEKKNSNSGA